MTLKRKKHIFVLTICTVAFYILYQLYFFLTLTSEANNRPIVSMSDLERHNDLDHLRSEEDKYINNYGVLRGVYFADMKNYRPDPNNEFNCRESHEKIPYDHVNDDFCDCEDGSDEPSTSACPDSIFYCDTQFPKRHSISIASGRVNDGICDCCDGSDEFISGNKILLSQSSPNHYRFYVKKCQNICHN